MLCPPLSPAHEKKTGKGRVSFIASIKGRTHFMYLLLWYNPRQQLSPTHDLWWDSRENQMVKVKKKKTLWFEIKLFNNGNKRCTCKQSKGFIPHFPLAGSATPGQPGSITVTDLRRQTPSPDATNIIPLLSPQAFPVRTMPLCGTAAAVCPTVPRLASAPGTSAGPISIPAEGEHGAETHGYMHSHHSSEGHRDEGLGGV